MISLYGCGFIGRNFKEMYNTEVDVQERDERVPLHNDILYMISTTHNYHVHDEDNLYKSGDKVNIIESKPISKLKKWMVVNNIGDQK